MPSKDDPGQLAYSMLHCRYVEAQIGSTCSCISIPTSPCFRTLLQAFVAEDHLLERLWPLHCLNEIHPDYRGHGQSDSRLTSHFEGRGLGGIGVTWRRDLDIDVAHATTSDHFRSIRVLDKSSGSTLTVIGVYLPWLNLGIDLYHA